MLSELYWALYVRRNRLLPAWQKLASFERLPGEEARRATAAGLLAQVQYFGRRADAMPEWREAASIRDPDELWRVWPSLPILTKADLVKRFEPKDMAARFQLRGKISSTGGSTGEPTFFFHDEAMTAASVATSIYAWRQMGWRPGMTMICVWGSDRDVGKIQQSRSGWLTRARNEVVIPAYEVNHETADRVLEAIGRSRKAAIFGFTSMLARVAELVIERGAALPRGKVATAWNGGEMLFEEQSETFRRAFGVPILNCYGGRELSLMAIQKQAGGRLLPMRPHLFAEVVDEQGRPAPPGQSGRLLWTSTVCRGTPFLRYEVGDMAEYAAADADESGVRALTAIHGRVAGLLHLPDGRTINCLYWNHLFKEFPEVRQFQVVWRAGKELQLRLRGTPFAPARETELRRVVGNFLGAVPLTITWMEHIPLTAQGKLMQVVVE